MWHYIESFRSTSFFGLCNIFYLSNSVLVTIEVHSSFSTIKFNLVYNNTSNDEITYLPNVVRCFIVDIICISILVHLFPFIALRTTTNCKLSSSISTDLTNLNEDQFTEIYCFSHKLRTYKDIFTL